MGLSSHLVLEGRTRVGSALHTTSKAQPCVNTIVMIGVGTAMSVGDYSSLSEKSVQNSSIALVMADHRPRNPFKHAWCLMIRCESDPRDSLARLAKYVHANIAKHVHRVCPGDTKFVLGGHSSSGITAAEVIVDDKVTSSFAIDAYLAIDPDYKRLPFYWWPWSDLDLSSLPSMVWGNSKNTCLVKVDSGGKFGYQKSSNKYRVLYQIQIPNEKSSNGHCDVTDRGCLVPVPIPGFAFTIPICPLSERNESTKTVVAASIQKLATAVQQSREHFNPQFLTLPMTLSLKIHMFVNSENVTATESGGFG